MDDPTNLTTNLVRRVAQGDQSAASELYGRVQSELAHRARKLMARQDRDHLLQATALVNEAWIKMMGNGPAPAADRAHFLAIAARAMHQLLIDHARAARGPMRGGDRARVRLDGIEPGTEPPGWKILAIGEALDSIEKEDARGRLVAELRLFGGLEHAEIAEHLGVSTRTVERIWKSVRQVLRSAVSEEASEGPAPDARDGDVGG